MIDLCCLHCGRLWSHTLLTLLCVSVRDRKGGKSIPTELRGQEKHLRHEMEYDDEKHEKPLNHIDDEYKNAGMFDPKIAITTSRDPSSRLKQFAQEIRLIFPNAIRLNRGAHTVGDVRSPLRAVLLRAGCSTAQLTDCVLGSCWDPQLVESARSHDYTDLLIVTETRGEPGTPIEHCNVLCMSALLTDRRMYTIL